MDFTITILANNNDNKKEDDKEINNLKWYKFKYRTEVLKK